MRCNRTDNVDLIPWRKFFTKFQSDDLGECWEWRGTIHHTGYGVIASTHNKTNIMWTAHRLSFMFFNGPIPKGHRVCHRCDNPTCVNPAHLFAGSDSENIADMFAKGRNPKRYGEHNGRAKLTEREVKEIRALRANGVPCLEIAARFGIKQPAVSNIANGTRWGHLKEMQNVE